MKKFIGILILIGLLVLGIFAGNLWEQNNANQVLVIQSLSGARTAYTTAGYKWQGLGKVTRLNKSFQYPFDARNGQGGSATDDSVKVRFNDGAHGYISGSVRVELPTDEASILALTEQYPTEESIVAQLTRPAIERSVYMTGPMMSSKESYAERRTELINFIEDQAAKGVYKTHIENRQVEDLTTLDDKGKPAWKSAQVVVIDRDPKTNEPLRQETSPFDRYRIKLSNLSINGIRYDDNVEKQINNQQEAIMSVQTAIAKAKEAQQAAVTAEADGRAKAATAKWEQETKNAKLVTEAEGQRIALVTAATAAKDAAEQKKAAAEFEKAALILQGEGESTKQKLLMSANGALDQKLAAYVEISKAQAQALANSRMPLVPSTVIGGGGAGDTGANSVQNLLQMLSAKTAQDLFGKGMNLQQPQPQQ